MDNHNIDRLPHLSSQISAKIEKQAYRVSEFCQAFSIGKSKFYQEVANGHLQTVKLGTRTLVTRNAAEIWINSLQSNVGHGKR